MPFDLGPETFNKTHFSQVRGICSFHDTPTNPHYSRIWVRDRPSAAEPNVVESGTGCGRRWKTPARSKIRACDHRNGIRLRTRAEAASTWPKHGF